MSDPQDEVTPWLIENWEASRKFKDHYRWSRAATKLDPTVDKGERGGNYDPLTPSEWSEAIGKMLMERGILDTITNRMMLDDFNNIHELAIQYMSVCPHDKPPQNPFYIHGATRRFVVRQHRNGELEAIASRKYDGTF